MLLAGTQPSRSGHHPIKKGVVGKKKPSRLPTARAASDPQNQPGMSTPRRRGLPVIIFLVCFGAYLSNGDPLIGGSTDARSNMLVALNLLKHASLLIDPSHFPRDFRWAFGPSPGNTIPTGYIHNRGYLRDWDNVKDKHYREGRLKPYPDYYLVRTVQPGRYASVYGIGTALTVFPVYAALNLVTDIESSTVLWYSTKVTASLLTAGAALFIFLTMRRFVPPLPAALGALAFGLGTSAWTLSSQLLWQQTAFLFFLSLGAWCLFDAHARRDYALYCGAAFGMAALCRPTGLIVVTFTGLYLLRTAPRHVFRYVLGGLPFAVSLLLYNTYAFGGPFAFGQEIAALEIARSKGDTAVWRTSLAEGLTGLLVSPSRGLFVYSPFMVFGFVGAVMAWRYRRHYAPLIPLQAAALVHIVVAAMWWDWWGGWAYGPRPLVDSGVLLTLLMIPVLARLGQANWRRGIFVTLLLYSVAVQAIGAWAYNEGGWNFKDRKAVGQIQFRSRLWDIGDTQIVHYATHLQVEREKKQSGIRHQLHGPGQIFMPSTPDEPSP